MKNNSQDGVDLDRAAADDSATPNKGPFVKVVEVDHESGSAGVSGSIAAENAAEVERLNAALEESEKRVLLAVADLDNFRKRANRIAQDQVKYASLPLLSEMLEAVDNLNRAIGSAQEDAGNETLLTGVKMVAGQLAGILESNNCKPIHAVGQPFDPGLHEAVLMQSSDEYPANTVMKAIRTGYTLHDRVVRTAQVFVSTGPPESA